MPECHVGRLSRDETRNLPAHVARAIAGDSLHSFDELVIEYPPIIAAGHGSQFDMAIVGLQCLDLLSTMRRQAILETDAGDRCRTLPEIEGRRANMARELPETPSKGSCID